MKEKPPYNGQSEQLAETRLRFNTIMAEAVELWMELQRGGMKPRVPKLFRREDIEYDPVLDQWQIIPNRVNGTVISKEYIDRLRRQRLLGNLPDPFPYISPDVIEDSMPFDLKKDKP